MLEVGQKYDITATPADGYEFSSWQPVNVFISIQTNYFAGNPVLPPTESIVPDALPTNIYGADLEFTMQDVTMITGEGQNPSISEVLGWQVNFVSVPEPTEAAIVGCGFAALTVARHRLRPKSISRRGFLI
jgi:hypothetical protein